MRTRLLLAALLAPALAGAAAPAPAAPQAPVAAAKDAKDAKPAAKDAKPGAAAPAARGPLASLRVPLMAESSASIPVAKVGDELIRLDELVAALAETHGAHGAGKGADRAFAPVLERILDTRLIALEARAIGLDELPEVARAIKAQETKIITDLLKEQVVKDVRHDQAAVDAAYREATRSWKVRALHFENVADASAASALVVAGRPFAEVAKQAVADKKAKDDGKSETLPADNLRPEVASALAGAKAGTVTAPISVQDGFALLLVEEIVHPDDAAKKAAIAKDQLAFEQRKALRAFYKKLVEKHAKVDTKLLAQLNFESKKGFEARTKDKRPLVRIKGNDPITVADLAEAMQLKFFHGMEAPIRDKKLNENKASLLDDLLARRMYLDEARAQRLDETDAYRLAVTQSTTALLFGKFTERVIAPEVKITEGDAKAYYEKHKDEYSYPAFYTIESLGFRTAKAAQAALAKVKAGTDFKWLRANAEGVVPDEDSTLQLPSTPLAASMMPADLVAVLRGTAAGDYRLFEERGQHHVLSVVAYTAPRPLEYKDSREKIAKKLFADAVAAKVKEWVAKLRAAQDVTIYITEIGS